MFEQPSVAVAMAEHTQMTSIAYVDESYSHGICTITAVAIARKGQR